MRYFLFIIIIIIIIIVSRMLLLWEFLLVISEIPPCYLSLQNNSLLAGRCFFCQHCVYAQKCRHPWEDSNCINTHSALICVIR